MCTVSSEANALCLGLLWCSPVFDDTYHNYGNNCKDTYDNGHKNPSWNPQR
eukprot:m.303251 g.303251  ORF g.303251 m.303251 type:complete len:51 (-) comp330915_c0_seq1:97-249(-)